MTAAAQGYAYFGGIDFSGAREPLSNLWTVVGVAAGDRLRILSVRPHAFRADLGRYVGGGWRDGVADEEAAILWGGDFPYGLPAQAAAAMGAGDAWAKHLAWVADRPADEVKDAAGDTVAASRIADSGGALAPLNIRLYKQTVEGLRWLHELREEAEVAVFPQDPRGSARTALIEVYPSATIRDLGLPRRNAPGKPGETRARAASLKPYLEIPDPDTEALVVTLEDAWDATIACLTAFLCRDDLDQPTRLRPEAAPQIVVEGWIYRAPAAV